MHLRLDKDLFYSRGAIVGRSAEANRARIWLVMAQAVCSWREHLVLNGKLNVLQNSGTGSGRGFDDSAVVAAPPVNPFA
jgi:hypothetical protein